MPTKFKPADILHKSEILITEISIELSPQQYVGA